MFYSTHDAIKSFASLIKAFEDIICRKFILVVRSALSKLKINTTPRNKDNVRPAVLESSSAALVDYRKKSLGVGKMSYAISQSVTSSSKIEPKPSKSYGVSSQYWRKASSVAQSVSTSTATNIEDNLQLSSQPPVEQQRPPDHLARQYKVGHQYWLDDDFGMEDWRRPAPVSGSVPSASSTESNVEVLSSKTTTTISLTPGDNAAIDMIMSPYGELLKPISVPQHVTKPENVIRGTRSAMSVNRKRKTTISAPRGPRTIVDMENAFKHHTSYRKMNNYT